VHTLKDYVAYFNKNDNELYKNSIDNAHALEWLDNNVPLFECPDKTVEMIYYFRWWTLRKHIKQTPEGFVITEFLPDVLWSGKYNVINAAVGHHLYEARWLRNAGAYVEDYINFILSNPESTRRYSMWFVDAVVKFYEVSGNMPSDRKFVEKLCSYYEQWQTAHGLDNGMFWSVDEYDAMEYSISGTWNFESKKGIRPTLNSYMCADCGAISRLAENAGMTEVAEKYRQKHKKLKKQINEILWDGDFFKALHYNGEDFSRALDADKTKIVRELIGYIPWCFNLADRGREKAFCYLESEEHFYTPYGLTTAEQNHPDYLYEADHECLWNGYIWPFATSQTLLALKNASRYAPESLNLKQMFVKLLKQYAESQFITLKNGEKIPWIDEVRHPLRDEWSSRQILKSRGWKAETGGRERGRDYNHSTFCDLVISGIVGVECNAESFSVNPIIPDDWEYFKLENLRFRSSDYTVIYDKTGNVYGCGKGITVFKDGSILNNDYQSEIR